MWFGRWTMWFGRKRSGLRGWLDVVWEDIDVIWEVFIMPERLPLCPEVEIWKNKTISGTSGSWVIFTASIIRSLKTPFKQITNTVILNQAKKANPIIDSIRKLHQFLSVIIGNKVQYKNILNHRTVSCNNSQINGKLEKQYFARKLYKWQTCYCQVYS